MRDVRAGTAITFPRRGLREQQKKGNFNDGKKCVLATSCRDHAFIDRYNLRFSPSPPFTPPTSLIMSKAIKSEAVFLALSGVVAKAGEELCKKIKGVIKYVIVDEEKNELGTWIIDLKTAPGSVTKAGEAKADVTLTVADDDFVQMSTGKMNPQQAFMQGKLKIKGNMGIAMKMSAIEKVTKKLMEGKPKSAGVFYAMEAGIVTKGPELCKKIKALIKFDITASEEGGAAGSWVIDLKNSPGSVVEGSDAKPDVTLTLADEDMLGMISGALNPQQLFMQGKLKIKGNMGVAMKLGTVMKSLGGGGAAEMAPRSRL